MDGGMTEPSCQVDGRMEVEASEGDAELQTFPQEGESSGVYIVQGELCALLWALQRGSPSSRWPSSSSSSSSHHHLHHQGQHHQGDEEQDALVRGLGQLKELLDRSTRLEEVDPNRFLAPFLDVIRSEGTKGPVTGLALSSVDKFLSYGLVDPSSPAAPTAAENVADAVTHARFVGTDAASDEVVLMRILHVLRKLLLSPLGTLLTNESVCEIMQSSFRFCFEMRLSELLRRSAEHALVDMVQLLFTRLPHFPEDHRLPSTCKKLKMRTGSVETNRSRKKGRSPKMSSKKQTHSPKQVDEPPAEPMKAESEPPEQKSVASKGEKDIRSEKSDPLPDAISEAPTDAMSEASAEVITEATAGETTESCKMPADIDAEAIEGIPEPVEVSPADVPTDCVVLDLGVDDDDETQNHAPSEQVQEVGLNLPPSQLEEPHSSNVNESATELSLSKANDSYLDLPSPSVSDVFLPSNASAEEEESGSVGSVDAIDISAEALDPTFDVMYEKTDYVNAQGVRFTQQTRPGEGANQSDALRPVPYGLPCVKELFRFLVSLVNPQEKQNSDAMIQIGLNLLTVALEMGGSSRIQEYQSLLGLIKDELCRHLFSLLGLDRVVVGAPQERAASPVPGGGGGGGGGGGAGGGGGGLGVGVGERPGAFGAALRICFLLFEGLRPHLKLQLEMFLSRLGQLAAAEGPFRVSYEHREASLEALVRLWRLPGLLTELYLNYDCDLYCSNLFEDLTKLLSKNAFPVSGLYGTHLLSLDALLAVVEAIEGRCQSRMQRNNKSKYANGGKGKIEVVHPTLPAASGRLLGCQLAPPVDERRRMGPRVRVTQEIPSHEQLMACKHKKKILASGTEHFNLKPSKGIQILQEHGLLSTPLNPQELASFLRENPRLDKRMIGEYVSNRKNLQVLEAFVRSFDFADTRVDEALRLYLETFRLPGEAPLISLVLEQFADHWYHSNGSPFANTDAAFTLAYAVIMLNVDQHNRQARRQGTPMTMEEFRRNVGGVNGGSDFDPEMLNEMYTSVASEEIVMPAEQTGLVRENYLWAQLLRRGMGKEGVYLNAPDGLFDHDLFALAWGPTVAAISFVLDRSQNRPVVLKAVAGFGRCATVAAHYGMSDVFDNLVISLCKFTTLMGASSESPDALAVSLGGNSKAQLAARTLFGLVHRHADILREGWRNLLDCLLQLFRCGLLPQVLQEAEDFVDTTGRVPLHRGESQTSGRRHHGVRNRNQEQTGLLSSLYSYISSSSSADIGNTVSGTGMVTRRSPEDEEMIRIARECIAECRPDLIISESKFLRAEALHEMIKALVQAGSQFWAPVGGVETGNGSGSGAAPAAVSDEEAAAFMLELLLKVAAHNRDRLDALWPTLRDHLYGAVVGAALGVNVGAIPGAEQPPFLLERAVGGLLRLAQRLLRRYDLGAPAAMQALRLLLLLRAPALQSVTRQLSYGLHELLKTGATSIRCPEDWAVVFTLLEVAGAGAQPPRVIGDEADSESMGPVQSDSEVQGVTSSCSSFDRGWTSDSELYGSVTSHQNSQSSGGWIVVGREEAASKSEGEATDSPSSPPSATLTPTKASGIEEPALSHPRVRLRPWAPSAMSGNDIVWERRLNATDPSSMLKGCESLALLVRDAAHVTPLNFDSCVQCLRTFAEASLCHANGAKRMSGAAANRKKKAGGRSRRAKSTPAPVSAYDADESDSEDTQPQSPQVAIQLLDLMHTLHTRAAQVLLEECAGDPAPSNEGSVWWRGWCPLLQGIARLCCDSRREVRTSAVTYLQRALLVPELQTRLLASQWEACFHRVLFPLLTQLLAPLSPGDPGGLEETRVRAATMLAKVFLQHLGPLMSLPTFAALWLTVLDFMDKYMHADRSDLLLEAVPESLKNMLLVMDTAGIFVGPDGPTRLWQITWDRVDSFLPSMREELFKSHPAQQEQQPPEESASDTTASPPDAPSESVVPEESIPVTTASTLTTSVSATSTVTTPTTAVTDTSLFSPAANPMFNVILQPPTPVSAPPVSTQNQPQLTLPLLLNSALVDGTVVPPFPLLPPTPQPAPIPPHQQSRI